MRLDSLGDLLIDVRKLAEYCLDPSHPRGRHKARVFLRALGISQGDAAWLRDILLTNGPAVEAIEVADDRFGRRLQADIAVARQDRSVVVRTLWIVESGIASARLVTCWVL